MPAPCSMLFDALNAPNYVGMQISNLHGNSYNNMIASMKFNSSFEVCHSINGPGISGPGGPFMLDIIGPAGPLMYPDQIFRYS